MNRFYLIELSYNSIWDLIIYLIYLEWRWLHKLV